MIIKVNISFPQTQTCHSSRFNRDIPIFQYKSRTIPITCVKILGFCFISKLDIQKGASLCGLKMNFIIGWIDGLGLILWTPRLSKWSRLASLSRRPELIWSADPRNSAAFEGSSHLSSILPIFLRLQRSGLRKSGKCEVQNYNSTELNSEINEATKLIYIFISAK